MRRNGSGLLVTHAAERLVTEAKLRGDASLIHASGEELIVRPDPDTAEWRPAFWINAEAGDDLFPDPDWGK